MSAISVDWCSDQVQITKTAARDGWLNASTMHSAQGLSGRDEAVEVVAMPYVFTPSQMVRCKRTPILKEEQGLQRT